ncbi:MAG: hypothetical protein EPO28_04690 [Saprospiraceae bacterium]|nr:MAG: hypothetical protein EPO28_04690 [Saprospiraceae bacterium]
MEKTYLVSVLRTLDKKEVKELRKWLASPAHNVRQDVRDLFEYLAAGNRLFSERFLEKRKVHAAVYPGRTFTDAEVRQVIHFLFKGVESFLLYNELQKDEVRSQAALARAYRQRQLPKLFQTAMDTARKMQEQQPYRNDQYFENEYILQHEQYNYLSGLGRSVPLNLQEVSRSNDITYLINKLQVSCIMLSHQKVFKTDYKMFLLDDVLARLEADPGLLENPAIAINYYSYKALSDSENEVHFQKLKEHINRYGDLFPPHEFRNTYLLAINYCIGRLNTGALAYVREAFDLYRQGLAKHIFLENGTLSRFTFRNIVATGLQLGEYDWVENFIHEYSQFLDEKHRNSFVQFNLGHLFFEKKDYEKSMRLIASLDHDDILILLNAKTMLLKMYYELDEFNALDSLLGSMNTYLQRKKVMGYHKANYKNIIRYTKKMLRVAPFSKEQKEKLKADIANANPLTERKWLLEQVDRL